MVHILVVFGALWLAMRLLQWYHFFRLDELPEFNRSVLEVMRQPLEDRVITISRAKYSTEYPASFMLVASMNPCPCGYYGHPTKKCVCNEYQRTHYMSKISGPLLDRIDLQIEVQPVDFDQLLCKPSAMPNSFEHCRGAANRSRRQMSSKAPGEPSAAIRQRVIAARMLQERRFKDEPGIHCNAQMTPSLHHRRPRRHRRRPRPPHHGSHRLPQPRPPHLPRHHVIINKELCLTKKEISSSTALPMAVHR